MQSGTAPVQQTPRQAPQPSATTPFPFSEVAVPTPQFNLGKARRTSRLEPPAREDTPDPFTESPADPFSPESSPDIRHSQDTRELEPSDLMAPVSLHQSFPQSEDEAEESQLFPGSDLF